MANDRPLQSGHASGEQTLQSSVAGARPSPVKSNAPPNTTLFDRQIKQQKKARLWRGFAIFSLVCLASALAYALTPHGQQTMGMIGGSAAMLNVAHNNPNLLFDHVGGDQVNILLIGRDVNWKETKVYDPKTKTYRRYHVHDEEAEARSDTMIVVSLDKRRKAIRMVSIPRDAIVHISDKYGRDKLNAAHAYGGPAQLRQTLHDELGLTIHRHAVIRFDGFKGLINQVGGVEVDVLGALQRNGKRTRLKYDDDYGNLHIDLQPGKQHLNGEQAHNYVRFRMDFEGDPGRIRRQQQVMRALAKSIMTQPFYKIPGLVEEVRRQFKTDMTDEEIASAATFAHAIGDASKIQPVTLYSTYAHRGSLNLNESKNKQLLSYIFGTTFNPERYMKNSPTTEDADVGGDNDDNQATRALLREAGLIDGAPPVASSPGETTDTGSIETSSRSVPESGQVVSRNNDLPATDVQSEVISEEGRSSRRSMSDDSGSERGDESSSRRSRRERRAEERRTRRLRDVEESSTPRSSTPRSSTPRQRQRRETVVTEEQRNSSESEAPGQVAPQNLPRPSEDLTVESPVPVPEGDSSPESAP